MVTIASILAALFLAASFVAVLVAFFGTCSIIPEVPAAVAVNVSYADRLARPAFKGPLFVDSRGALTAAAFKAGGVEYKRAARIQLDPAFFYNLRNPYYMVLDNNNEIIVRTSNLRTARHWAKMAA